MDFDKMTTEQLFAVLDQMEQERMASREKAKQVKALLDKRQIEKAILIKLKNNQDLKPAEAAYLSKLDPKAVEALTEGAKQQMANKVQTAIAGSINLGTEVVPVK